MSDSARSFLVSLRDSNKQFTVTTDETILTAALKAGVQLPYGCKNGACGSCKAQVVAGEVDLGAATLNGLPDSERKQGMALLCCAKPQSDLTIACREVQGTSDIPIKKMPVRVASVVKPVEDVAIIRLQLPANDRMNYLAGQYIEVLLKNGVRRAYSLATAPQLADQLELHIRHLSGGLFTDHIFGTLKEKEIWRIEGPFGQFFLREDSDAPMILLASGTGFAPIKAIVEQAIAKQMTRPMTLYWGGRTPRDLYLHELAEQWARELPQFSYVPVVSEPNHALSADWSGRTGLVHQAVMADCAADGVDLSRHQVYACGAPVMVDAARTDFVAQCGLAEDAFFADAFISQADVMQ